MNSYNPTADNFFSHVDDIIERHIEEGAVSPELRDKISFVLLRKHRHQTKKPIHRSLADIGKVGSSPGESPDRSWMNKCEFHGIIPFLISCKRGLWVFMWYGVCILLVAPFMILSFLMCKCVYMSPGRNPARSPVPPSNFNRSIEDLRSKHSASYGRLRTYRRGFLQTVK